MVLCLRINREAPTLAVNSATGDWRSDIGIGDSTVIDGEIEPLDRMCIEEWLSLHRDDLAEAWHLLGEGHSPDPVEPLPDDWPIGGPPQLDPSLSNLRRGVGSGSSGMTAPPGSWTWLT